jgi:CRISPR-associated protein Cmr1
MMVQPLDIQIRTLTPLWTGGIDGTCDRLHISGLIGSMRSYYEAIIRGLGGYACDPTGNGCIYVPFKESDPEHTGNKSICAACYLFGTTGWARLFRLSTRINDTPESIKATENLHFRAFNKMNAHWLKTVFEGPDGQSRPNIDVQHMVYFQEPLSFHFTWRGLDSSYANQQIQMLFGFLMEYAGFGPKQQFGFGQIRIESPLSIKIWKIGLAEYKKRQSDWLSQKQPMPQPVFKGGKVLSPNLEDFFCVSCLLPNTIYRDIQVGKSNHVTSYLSSAFDIRYKGNERTLIGFRRYLDGKNPNGLGWSHESLNAFLGASKRKDDRAIRDDERSGSRIFVSMPYRIDDSNNYRLRMYGFALPNLTIPGGTLTVTKGIDICKDYLEKMQATLIDPISGPDLLKGVQV